MLQSQLYIGSENFETTETAKAINTPPNEEILTRDYPLTIAAKGDTEEQAMTKVRMLLTERRMWMVLRPDGLTNRTRSLAFRMLMRAGAKVFGPLASRPSLGILGDLK